jgi:phage terminase small subunit
MPRKSAEDRSAAYWRSGGKPPRPPDVLSSRAKQIWKRIVATRPYDYFDAAAQVLLAQFVELSATQEINLEMVRREPTNGEWQHMATRMQATLNSCAVKLRLSPSAVLSKKDGRLTEREVDVGDNVLLFGDGKF